MTPEQVDGITKARLTSNLTRPLSERFATNADYEAWVCEMAGLETLPPEAADSYAAQFSGQTIQELEDAVTASLIEESVTTPVPVEQWPSGIPQVVPMAQARIALFMAGKLSAVDAAIASLPSPNKELAQIEWEFRPSVRRDSALVAALGPALGLDDEAVDALFISAASIP